MSLSSGMLGEPFIRHELELGLGRLRGYGLEVRFSPNAAGAGLPEPHPEARAADLLWAFREPEVDMILCDIGGDDTSPSAALAV